VAARCLVRQTPRVPDGIDHPSVSDLVVGRLEGRSELRCGARQPAFPLPHIAFGATAICGFNYFTPYCGWLRSQGGCAKL
jgi:hypothetical protein